MKTPIIVGNWKANKTIAEAKEWIGEFRKNLEKEGIKRQDLEIVLCPPFTLIQPLKLLINEAGLSIKLGAQDISQFSDGAYTGEITGRMLKDLEARYVLVGHSERRRYFAENDNQVAQKIKISLNFDITPIICISELQQFSNILSKLEADKLDKVIFMYEPPEAISAQVGPIGQGKAESVQKVVEAVKKMKELAPESRFFYGGSIKSQNVADFLHQSEIDGVVSGSASQNAEEFARMIGNAA